MTNRHARQSNMFESWQTTAAKNIINKELHRFKGQANQMEAVYLIIYRERMATRSPDRRVVFDQWLAEHSQHNKYLQAGSK